VDSHLKPYRCKIQTCKELRFPSAAFLLRHEREVHAMHGHGDKPFFCTYEGCERGVAGNGFPRLWNLRDHMRRVHKEPRSPKSNAYTLPPLSRSPTPILSPYTPATHTYSYDNNPPSKGNNSSASTYMPNYSHLAYQQTPYPAATQYSDYPDDPFTIAYTPQNNAHTYANGSLTSDSVDTPLLEAFAATAQAQAPPHSHSHSQSQKSSWQNSASQQTNSTSQAWDQWTNAMTKPAYITPKAGNQLGGSAKSTYMGQNDSGYHSATTGKGVNSAWPVHNMAMPLKPPPMTHEQSPKGLTLKEAVEFEIEDSPGKRKLPRAVNERDIPSVNAAMAAMAGPLTTVGTTHTREGSVTGQLQTPKRPTEHPGFRGTAKRVRSKSGFSTKDKVV
jgi:hypothetical protein